ncbi:hypothetical protein ACE6H2_027102 [Prunus campanulata]
MKFCLMFGASPIADLKYFLGGTLTKLQVPLNLAKAMDVDMEINMVGENSFSSSDDARDDHTCGFKCNICLELADQDPIVTPCGHLYCWPCLYRWLRVCSSQSNKLQCPACTTVIKEKKLIPIYGIESDRRSPSVPPGFKIPNRPSPSSSSSNRRSVRQIRNARCFSFQCSIFFIFNWTSSSSSNPKSHSFHANGARWNRSCCSRWGDTFGVFRKYVIVPIKCWILSNKCVIVPNKCWILWKDYVRL